MPRTRDLVLGASIAIGAKALIDRMLLEKFRGDVRALDSGDYSGLLSAYADDAVLRFNDGSHRWAGEHRGKDAIEKFLENYTAAGVQGEVREIWSSGPPWAMTLAARFDDHATGPDGSEFYSNRVMMRIKTRWGKIVDHADFYEDTDRISEFEKKLSEIGVEPVEG